MSITHRRQPSRQLFPGLPSPQAIVPPGQKKNTSARLSGKGLVFISVQSPVAAGVVDFDFTSALSAYRSVHFILTNILPSVDAARLNVRFSVNSGVSFDVTASYLWSHGIHQEALAYVSTGSATGMDIPLTGANIGNAVNEGYAGQVTVYPFTAGNVRTMLSHKGMYLSSDPTAQLVTMFGGGSKALAVNAIRFFMTTGTITGAIAMYGND